MMRLLAATALASTLLVQPALAQSAQPQATDTGAGIGEIVVTAQKRAENVQDVPIAISAVSSQFLQSRAISSIDGLGAIAPNLVVDRAPSNKTATQIGYHQPGGNLGACGRPLPERGLHRQGPGLDLRHRRP